MSKDKYEQLLKEYPDIYSRGRCSYFECGEGWYDILKDLSEELRQLKFDGTVDQVKEKWGTLSFYVSLATKEQYDAIRKAEIRSETTCEFCGEPGTITRFGWIRTLCPKCAAQVKEDYDKRMEKFNGKKD